MIMIIIEIQGKGTACKPDQYIANKINYRYSLTMEVYLSILLKMFQIWWLTATEYKRK